MVTARSVGNQAVGPLATGELLPRTFYARDAATVARSLLGTVIVRCGESRVLRARIVETEAYVGENDLACHAARGRTRRTEVMFGPPGRAYVYLIYGMHHMFNVVTGDEGSAEAVLVRAAEPLDGLDAPLCGPGRLTRALSIDRDLNGHDLCREPLTLVAGTPPTDTVTASRIGVEYAGEWADAPLRFYDSDSKHVSRR